MNAIVKSKKVHNEKGKGQWKRMIPFYVMALPGMAYFICNNYLPMFGMVIAFKDLDFRKGIWGSDWCGFSNFRFLFRSGTATVIIRNTILYNVVFLVLGTILALVLAILMNEVKNKITTKVYQTLILLPFLMSWVVVSYLANALLATDTGLINNMLTGLGAETANWYSEKAYWPYILTFCYIWKTTGYTTIIYLAAVVGISTDYYEAAQVDGATKWKQIRSITLPLLKPTVITMMILSMGRIFSSDFGLFYQVTRNSGALYSVTQTIDVYVYNALMNNNDYAMSSAASVFQSCVGFAMVLITNGIIRKTSKENALF